MRVKVGNLRKAMFGRMLKSFHGISYMIDNNIVERQSGRTKSHPDINPSGVSGKSSNDEAKVHLHLPYLK
jgi:hypothetical protein